MNTPVACNDSSGRSVEVPVPLYLALYCSGADRHYMGEWGGVYSTDNSCGSIVVREKSHVDVQGFRKWLLVSLGQADIGVWSFVKRKKSSGQITDYLVSLQGHDV